MAKHPLLVFSGGMDSSYMLWKQLEQGDVHTCYIKATQSQEKIEMELAAREKIIKFFEDKTGREVLSDTIVDLGNAFVASRTNAGIWKESWNNNVPDHTFSQALVWPFGLQFAADGQRHSEVCLGYVMGDQFAMHLGDMEAAWRHTCNFARYEPIPMRFPLMYKTKDRILAEMPLEIIPDLWICELSKSVDDRMVACEKCPACETMAKTVFIWERRNERTFQSAIDERLADLASRKTQSEEADGKLKDSHEVDGLRKKESGGCDLQREPDGASQIAHAEEE